MTLEQSVTIIYVLFPIFYGFLILWMTLLGIVDLVEWLIERKRKQLFYKNIREFISNSRNKNILKDRG